MSWGGGSLLASLNEFKPKEGFGVILRLGSCWPEEVMQNELETNLWGLKEPENQNIVQGPEKEKSTD